MNWLEDYKRKCVTADEAVKLIPAHSHCGMPDGAGEPSEIIRALERNYQDLTDLTFFQASSTGGCNMFEEDMVGHIRYETFIASPGMKDAWWKGLLSGRADYVPAYFSTAEDMISAGRYPIDVAILSVSAPDTHGYCSFGLSASYQRTIFEEADLVIAQVNDQMPRTHGENFVHVNDIDYIVEVSVPIALSPKPSIGEEERLIGEYCASLVEDGSTIQAGIGKLPNAIMEAMSNKKDLGVHTELFTTTMMELTEKGVINGRAKTLHRGYSITTFAQGTKELYDWIDDNPFVQFHPVKYVNNPYVIAQNDKFVSINSCVEVDLFGQVAAESIAYKQLSGAGGQVDFVRGATMSKGGKSIIAMNSTAGKGKVSKIKLFLPHGTPVTTPRDETQFIVTEYGIADLRGKTNQQRARALINIAHPNFRDQLRDEYHEHFGFDPFK